MKLYSQNKHYKLYNGNMLDMREVIEPESIDSIVTDPPYGLTSIVKRFGSDDAKPAGEAKDGSFARLTKGFMGKTWDGSGIEYNVEAWRRCYEVLKPGGYLLAFGGSRTFYRIACAIEDAGFEIRDTVMWLYGSGFPKSMALGKAIDNKQGNERIKTGNILHHAQKGVAIAEERGAVGGGAFGVAHDEEETIGTSKWEGWGTALKPAFEPVIVARKPFKGSCVDNVIKYGVGGVNIDECRIGNETIKGGTTPSFRDIGKKSKEAIGIDKLSFGQVQNAERIEYPEHTGRFPSNVIFTYDDNDFEEVCGGLPNGGKNGSISKRYKMNNQVYGEYGECNTWDAYNDSGSAARYFYCAKASTRDRDEGLEGMLSVKCNDGRNKPIDNAFQRGETLRKNTHPTVKPTDLMQYLVRLVTPEGGTVLDPFNGSGSTGKAVMYENKDRNKNYKYIGIEMTEEYLPIAKARIEYVINEEEPEPEKTGQMTIFDLMGV
jgi:site-specific DNA-methyltransferase (adenine-specific)